MKRKKSKWINLKLKSKSRSKLSVPSEQSASDASSLDIQLDTVLMREKLITVIEVALGKAQKEPSKKKEKITEEYLNVSGAGADLTAEDWKQISTVQSVVNLKTVSEAKLCPYRNATHHSTSLVTYAQVLGTPICFLCFFLPYPICDTG